MRKYSTTFTEKNSSKFSNSCIENIKYVYIFAKNLYSIKGNIKRVKNVAFNNSLFFLDFTPTIYV